MLDKEKRHLAVCATCESFSYLRSYENITAFYREHRHKHMAEIEPPNLATITVVYDRTEEGDAWLSALLKWRTNHADK